MTQELTPQEYKYLNPLLLAYIGDAVYELRVREHLLTSGAVKMNGLHQQAVSLVNAGRQSRLYSQLEPLLSEEEKDVFRRGRNAHSGHQPPGVSAAGYRRATGVEALIGWLHLTGEKERLDEIFRVLFAADDDEAENGEDTE